MKKTGLLLIVLLVVSASAFAQGIVAKGVKVGMNIANLKGDDAEETDAVVGGVFGAFVTYKLNEMISVQPEMLFTMKGTSFEWDYTESYGSYVMTEKEDVTYSLSYLEIPVLVQYQLPAFGDIQPNVFAGPSLGFNIGAIYDVDYSYEEYEDGELIYLESYSGDGDIDDVEAVDLGLNFGAGAKYNQFTVDARFNIGMTDVIKDVKAQNTVMSLMVGYCF
jgi:hypothetical protein